MNAIDDKDTTNAGVFVSWISGISMVSISISISKTGDICILLFEGANNCQRSLSVDSKHDSMSVHSASAYEESRE